MKWSDIIPAPGIRQVQQEGHMKLQTIFASSLLSLAGVASAVVNTTSGTGEFSAFAGFGYSYTATWESDVPLSLRVLQFSGMSQGVPGAGVTLQLKTADDPFDLPQLSINATMELRFINLATGELGLPLEFYNQPPLVAIGAFSSGASGNPCTTPGASVELRFSNPSCVISSSIDKSGWRPGLDLSASASTSYVIRPGNFLVASDDPSCASFSCMTPGHDLIMPRSMTLAGYLSAANVPEPSTYALFALGLGAVLAVSRRRKA